MRKILGVLSLACAVLLTQTNLLAQKKEGSKAEKNKTEAKAADTKGKKPGATKNVTPEKSADPVVGKTKDGRAVYEGTRGGFYYLTESGSKSYVSDFVGAKVVGKTDTGLPIYEGPRGGRFYYSTSGEKVYVKN